mgnify:CR=1 FL=1
MDKLTRLLESVGCIVTGTLSDAVAIDLAGSSDYDALLIAGGVSQSDGRYVTTKARDNKVSMPVIVVQGPKSILTQLRQAGISL